MSTEEQLKSLEELLEILLEEYGLPELAAFWTYLGQVLASNSPAGLTGGLTAILLENFNNRYQGPYQDLAQVLANTVRATALTQLTEDKNVISLVNGQIKGNPFLLSKVVGEA